MHELNWKTNRFFERV